MTITWSQVHVGDKLRGQDGGTYDVTAREPGDRWALAGAHDAFTMRGNGREVTVKKKLIDPAPVVERADHSDQAQAWQVLTDGGFRLQPIGESTVTDEDQFGAPAARDDESEGGLIVRGRYKMPHPDTGEVKSFTRVSNITKILADSFGLERWEKRMVAKGIAIREDLAALAAALDADDDEDKGKLDSVVKQAKDAAKAKRGANNGSAFHKFAERHDKGEPLESMSIPKAFAADVNGYVSALKARSLKVIPQYMERTVFVPELEIVGTLDRIVSQPTGPTHSDERAICDLKSGKDLSYGWMEIAIQQAFYANASHMWDKANKRWEPMPAVDKSRALIAWSPIGVGHTEIYGVDLIKGWKLAKAAMHVRAWRNDTYHWLVAPESPDALVRQLISTAANGEALAALWTRHKAIWTDELTALGKQRLAQLDNR